MDGRRYRVVRDNGRCIKQLVWEERIRLEDAEGETGTLPSENYLNFLWGKFSGGITLHYNGLKREYYG
jgi:hypothetical protein